MGFWKNGNGLRAWHLLRRYLHDKRGNIATMTVLLIVPLTAIMALGTESGGWYLIQRAEQNAADAAALAAATNGYGNPSGTTYIGEAKVVSSNLGFTDAANNTTVLVSNTDNSDAACASACYSVTISRKVPFYLGQITGYGGNTTVNGGAAVTVAAKSVVLPPGSATGYCMVGLGTSGNAITLSGGNGTDLTGCNMASNSGLKCNGINSDYGVQFGDAVTSSNCGTQPRTGVQYKPDLSTYNFTTNASLLGTGSYTNTCGTPGNPYHYLGDPNFSTFTNNNVTSDVNWASPSVHVVCGDLKITGNRTITTAVPDGTVLLIVNGQLNLPNTTDWLNATGLTIIFTGTAGDTHNKFPTGNGTLNYSAPTSGTWKGIALYQDPALVNNNPTKCNGSSDLNWCSAGNSPGIYITGLIYMPKAEIDITGSINHQQNGFACFSTIALTIVMSGTNDIFANPTGQCNRAGLSLPGVPGTQTRLALIR